jgi:hypothetical protein
VSLRRPPPLERPLEIVRSADQLSLRDGGTVIAEGRTARIDIDLPVPIDLVEAETASSRYLGFGHHPFPMCFVCGPDRDERHGLRLFPGAVEGTD